MAGVRLVGLRKVFGDVVAVDDIDLEIGDGSFTVLLGPSGCGKTTTLNAIAGLEDPTAGQIFFDEQEVQYLPPHRRDIAMVFQSYALYPNRTVRENIAFGLRMRRIPKKRISASVDAAAGRLGLHALLDRLPKELSGGQQQRVALARAIVREPRVFLFDEPLSNLDAKLRADMRVELRRIQAAVGGTFVYVTHDQVEAMSLADVVVVMDHGRIQQVDAPLTMYRKPANKFVAAFIGSPEMNLMDGHIDSRGVFETGGWSTTLGRNGPYGGVTLGVRAEDLVVEGVDSGEGLVEVVERLGTETLLAIKLGPLQLIARVHPDVTFAPGDQVRVGANPQRIHLFDPASGVRLTAGEPILS